MGVLLDSTFLIAERTGKNRTSLAHGTEPADSIARRAASQRFIDQVPSAIPAEPVNPRIAFRARMLNGLLQAKGTQTRLVDLLIGATAWELVYSIASQSLHILE